MASVWGTTSWKHKSGVLRREVELLLVNKFLSKISSSESTSFPRVKSCGCARGGEGEDPIFNKHTVQYTNEHAMNELIHCFLTYIPFIFAETILAIRKFIRSPLTAVHLKHFSALFAKER